MYSLKFRDLLPENVLLELESLAARLRVLWYGQHGDDGTHTDVTCDSLIVGGVSIPQEIEATGDGFPDGGTPGQVVKRQLDLSLAWQDDLTAMAGSGEDNVQVDWGVIDTTSDAFILNKPILFSGDYPDLTNLPTLFSGSYPDLTNKPTLFGGSYLDLTDVPTFPAAVSRANVYGFVKDIIIDGANITTTDDDTAQTISIAGMAGGGGGGTDTNDYVDDLALALSGQDLTVTLGRTGALADLAQTVTLPAGGGGTAVAADPIVFSVHMGALASVSLTTSWQDVLSFIAAAVDINDGGFTFPEVSSRRSIVFASAGKYAVKGTLAVERASGGRTGFGVRVQHTRGSTITHYGESWGGYSRGSGDSDLASTSVGFDLDIEAGDSITIEASTSQSETGNVGGNGSYLSIHKIASLTGASVTTNRQRVEGVTFNSVPSTTTQLRVQTVSSVGIAIDYGEGPVEMLAATPGENTFTILERGVYLMEWIAVITPDEARPEPCLQILDNRDNTLLGQIDPTYIRFVAGGAYHVRRAGPVVIPEDNMVVRAIVENCRTDNAFTVAGGHQLNFIRGALGARGADGTGGGGGGGGDGDTLTGIQTFSYLDATRAIVLNFNRLDGSTNNGQIILPDFLDATEVWDWSLASNTDRLPINKHGLDVVTGITSVTYDTTTRNLRVRLPQADGGDTFQEATLPEFLASADVQDWAETGNTDDIPDSKLPGALIDSIASFTYDVTSRILQLELRRLNNATIAGNVTLPQFLAEAAVETWALTANPNEDIPSSKLPAHTVGLLPAFDPGSNVFSLARTTSAGSTVTTTTTFPEWAEEDDLYDWVFTGNTDRLPYSKIPIHLRSLGTFGFDAATRVLSFSFQDTTPCGTDADDYTPQLHHCC